MVQIPAATPVTLLPLTVHTEVVWLVKVTARPELAVAVTVVVPWIARVAGLKVIAPIVCEPMTVMLLVTVGAAL